MASPRTITIVALSVALGLFFVFMGTIKLTPRLSRDAYNEMVSRAARTEVLKGSPLAAGAGGTQGVTALEPRARARRGKKLI